MDAWLTWALVGLGLTYGITQSWIGRVLRLLVARIGFPFEVLVYCPACTGFWVGLYLGAAGLWPGAELFWSPVPSALALMALGALWGNFVGSDAFLAEAHLRRGQEDDAPETIEAREE